MSGSLNKVMLIGNLGANPEIRTIPSGDKVANFNIATTEKFKSRDGQQQEKTEWHRIVMWRGLADIAERYLQKGAKIYVEGKLTTRSWDDQNGQKRYTTEIIADQMQMLGGRGQGGDGQNQDYSSQSAPGGQQYGGSSYQAPQAGYSQNKGQSAQPGPDSMPGASDDDLPF